jgi:hypothetical protein
VFTVPAEAAQIAFHNRAVVYDPVRRSGGHAGAHLTFALVELASWRNPETGDINLKTHSGDFANACEVGVYGGSRKTFQLWKSTRFQHRTAQVGIDPPEQASTSIMGRSKIWS